jgi:hypothetical protein
MNAMVVYGSVNIPPICWGLAANEPCFLIQTIAFGFRQFRNLHQRNGLSTANILDCLWSIHHKAIASPIRPRLGTTGRTGNAPANGRSSYRLPYAGALLIQP